MRGRRPRPWWLAPASCRATRPHARPTAADVTLPAAPQPPDADCHGLAPTDPLEAKAPVPARAAHRPTNGGAPRVVLVEAERRRARGVRPPGQPRPLATSKTIVRTVRFALDADDAWARKACRAYLAVSEAGRRGGKRGIATEGSGGGSRVSCARSGSIKKKNRSCGPSSRGTATSVTLARPSGQVPTDGAGDWREP